MNSFLEQFGQFEALQLAARERIEGLPNGQVGQSDILQGLHSWSQRLTILVHGLAGSQFQHLGDVETAVSGGQSLR